MQVTISFLSLKFQLCEQNFSYKPTFAATSLSSFVLLPMGDENLVLINLITVGPLSAAIDASQLSFQNYFSGVYNDPLCTRVLNHAILWDIQRFFFLKNNFVIFQKILGLLDLAPITVTTHLLTIGWLKIHTEQLGNKK